MNDNYIKKLNILMTISFMGFRNRIIVIFLYKNYKLRMANWS